MFIIIFFYLESNILVAKVKAINQTWKPTFLL